MPILDKIQIGVKVLNLGHVVTIVEDLGGGEFRWEDNSVPPATGTIYFAPDDEENSGLIVIE